MPDFDPVLMRPNRPWPVVLAGIIFCLMSFGILIVHVALTLKLGVVDWMSYGVAAYLFVALLFWLGRPQSTVTYYIGGIGLLVCTVRDFRTAWGQYHNHSSVDMSQMLPSTLVIGLFMIVLTWNYLFSKASRAYFSL